MENNIFNFKEPVEGIFIEPTNKTINVCEFSDKKCNGKIIVGTPGKGKMYTNENKPNSLKKEDTSKPKIINIL